jgi:SAM-dependent methyltransferase
MQRVDRRRQYEIERELAARLKSATAEERRELYGAVYDDLFRRAPAHNRLDYSADARERNVQDQIRLLRRLVGPNSVFLEIGPGDYKVVNAIGDRVRRAFAVDVARARARAHSITPSVELHFSDGTSVPVPQGTVSLAYSNQLLEHLHPDDAHEHLCNVHRALTRGGRYVCITPNRLSGPHDMSRHFGDVASGLHLKEYTIAEVGTAFAAAGFSKTRAFLSYRGRILSPPVSIYPFRAYEWIVARAPGNLRMKLASPLAAVKIVGTK